MEEKKTDNILSKTARNFVQQAEKTAPKLSDAVEDWQRLYIGLVETSFKLQKGVLETMGLKPQLIDQMEEMVMASTESVMEIQTQVTKATIELTLNATKSILEKTNQG